MVEQALSTALIGPSRDFHSSWFSVANYLYINGGTAIAYKPYKKGFERVIITRVDNGGLLVRPENSGFGFEYKGPMDARANDLIFPADNILYFQKTYSNWLAAAKQEKYYSPSDVKEVVTEDEDEYKEMPNFEKQLDVVLKYVGSNGGVNTFSEGNLLAGGTWVEIQFMEGNCYDNDPTLDFDPSMNKLLSVVRKTNSGSVINKIKDHSFDASRAHLYNFDAFHLVSTEHSEFFPPLDARPYISGLTHAFLSMVDRARFTAESIQNISDKLLACALHKKGFFNIDMHVGYVVSPLYDPALIGLEEDEFKLQVFATQTRFIIQYTPLNLNITP